MFEFESDHDVELLEDTEAMVEFAELLGCDVGELSGAIFENLGNDELLAVQADVEELIDKARQAALAGMHRCPCNFAWKREGQGYRCEGGMHYVTDSEIDKFRK